MTVEPVLCQEHPLCLPWLRYPAGVARGWLHTYQDSAASRPRWAEYLAQALGANACTCCITCRAANLNLSFAAVWYWAMHSHPHSYGRLVCEHQQALQSLVCLPDPWPNHQAFAATIAHSLSKVGGPGQSRGMERLFPPSRMIGLGTSHPCLQQRIIILPCQKSKKNAAQPPARRDGCLSHRLS